jgi:hypothetical protein
MSVPTSLTMDFDPYHRTDLDKDLWSKHLVDAGFAIRSTVDMEFEAKFRDFAGMIKTTWQQKLSVINFLRKNPCYMKDRFLNWMLRNRFYWCSTMFVCRKA